MCCSEAEHAKEGGPGLLVAGGEGVPFFQAGPGSRRGSDWCRSIPGRTPAHLCAGEGGLAARPYPGCARANCRKLERSRRQPSRALLASDRAGLVPSAIRVPVPARARTQWPRHGYRRSHRPWCPNRHESGQALHDNLAADVVSPFRAGRLVRPDGSAVDNRHVKRDPTLMHQLEPTFLDALPGPVDEQLCSQPPRAKLRGDAAPLGLVLVPSRDCRNGPPQPFRRRLAARPNLFGRRLPHRSTCVHENLTPTPIHHASNMSALIKLHRA